MRSYQERLYNDQRLLNRDGKILWLQKKRSPKRRKRDVKRFNISISHNRIELAYVHCDTEEEKRKILQKAKKNSIVDEIHVGDRGENKAGYRSDWVYETHIKVRGKWKLVKSEDFNL